MKRWIFLLAAGMAVGAFGDGETNALPLRLTNVVLQTWGNAELSEETPQAGTLFLREDDKVYVGDGHTRGGVPVCDGHPDWHNFHKRLKVNGNEVAFNGTWTGQAVGNVLAFSANGQPLFRILAADEGEFAALDLAPDGAVEGAWLVSAATTSTNAALEATTNLVDSSWAAVTNAEIAARTAAGTTWRVRPAPGFKALRVRTTTTRAPGIYSELPFVYSEGLTAPSLRLGSDTNLLESVNGELMWGGNPISGVADLAAVGNISLSTNESTKVVTIATTPNVSFQDVIVHGDLSVVGVSHHQRIIHEETIVDHGTVHTYEVRYTTNYTDINVVTNHVNYITNHITEVTEIGSVVDYEKARSVSTPSFAIDNTDTNHPLLSATGTWNMAGCTIIEDGYVPPFVKVPDGTTTNSFSTDDPYLQQLDLSELQTAAVCWNKPDPTPYALMHCRLRIGTSDGSAVVTWTTNNVLGLDVDAISTNRWSWIQLESYPDSPNFSVISQWEEPGS